MTSSLIRNWTSKTKTDLWSILAAAIALTLGGCAGGADPRPTGIVYARGAASIKLDPADITDGESVKVCTNIYEGLLEYEETSTKVRPCLAESWEHDDAGLVYRFKLRAGVKFHDGTPLDAAAVANTFNRQASGEHPHNFGLAYAYWHDMFETVIKSVAAEDERTVKIELFAPHAPFLANLAMFTVGIVSPQALTKHGRDIARNPVGTGPYRFVRWTGDDQIDLERNPDYWRDAARVDRLAFVVNADNDNRLLRMKSGEYTFMDGLDTDHFATVEKDERLVLARQPGMNVAYLSLNHRHPPFDDVRVRRAVCHALRKREIASDAYDGHAVAAKNPLPPVLWGHADAIVDYAFDQARARELLAEAGWSDEKEVTLYVMDNPRPYMPEPGKLAQIIQHDLGAVGMKVKIHPSSWEAHLKAVHNAEHDMALLGWIGDNGDPDNFIYVLCDKANARLGSASNISFYESDPLHEVLVAAQKEFDQEKRAALYVQAQEIIHADVGMVPLVHTEDAVVLRSGVNGFIQHPTGTLRLRGVSIP